MSDHFMDCERYQEAIFAILQGVDGEIPDQDVRRHLQDCATCRREAPGIAREFVAINNALVPDPSESGWKSLDEQVISGLRKVPEAAGDPSAVFPAGLGGETMLDMGSAGAKKAPPLPPSAPPLPADQSGAFPLGVGGETMLDMGQGKAAAPPPPAPPNPVPASSDASVTMMPDDGGETMLGMGRTVLSPSTRAPLPKLGKEGDAPVSATDATIPSQSPTGVTKVPGDTSAYDVTVQGGATATGDAALPSADFKTMQIPGDTPRSATSSAAGLANLKSIPPEALKAAKDPTRVFGKYILMSELGRGGVGVVYKAWDTLILQYVALKFIKATDDEAGTDSAGSGTSQVEEFQREARMSVRLRHPNIVRVYEFGCMSNRYYLSMEYIDGGSLLSHIHGKERNQKTRFNSDPEKFVRMMRDICFAVDYAHNSKPPVIHRDLKPHNVLVDGKGNPYVVDFGLAKEVDSGEGATLTGVVKGTPTYMAPEQAEGRNRDVDPRTDVYALGCILYEILTGRPPFLGDSVPEILRKIATEIPERPNEIIARNSINEAAAAAAAAASSSGSSKSGSKKTKPLLVAKPLEVICLKAIEKPKNFRYQSAKELGEDLDRYLKKEDILAQEPGLSRRIRRKIRKHPIISGVVAAAMLVAMTAGVAFSFFGSPGDSREKLIENAVIRGDQALAKGDWSGLKTASDDLASLERGHKKVGVFEKALREHRDLVEKTEREWSADLDRIRREPLAGLIEMLREPYNRCPELKPKFSESLRQELVTLERRSLEEARRLVGSGARPAWVEEVIKKSAKETKDQVDALIGLAQDRDFKYPTEQELPEASAGLARVIDYRGTWALKVNVAPFAEVRLSRDDKELAGDLTPLGMTDLEVVTSNYVVELFWPSRQDPRISVRQEVGALTHGQTVVIRGDISKDRVTQERR